MWLRKNKIKENKRIPFRKNQSTNFSVWDSMSFIEQICLIVLPIMLCTMFYIMLEITGLIWWVRLLISIGMVTGCIGLITLIVNYFTEY
tara:strand:- start:731 stop:997 length:267 start_codon:yes stop_codon:yes gene_type:complete